MVRTGLWGPLYDTFNKESPNRIGNALASISMIPNVRKTPLRRKQSKTERLLSSGLGCGASV